MSDFDFTAEALRRHAPGECAGCGLPRHRDTCPGWCDTSRPTLTLIGSDPDVAVPVDPVPPPGLLTGTATPRPGVHRSDPRTALQADQPPPPAASRPGP